MIKSYLSKSLNQQIKISLWFLPWNLRKIDHNIQLLYHCLAKSFFHCVWRWIRICALDSFKRKQREREGEREAEHCVGWINAMHEQKASSFDSKRTEFCGKIGSKDDGNDFCYIIGINLNSFAIFQLWQPTKIVIQYGPRIAITINQCRNSKVFPSSS